MKLDYEELDRNILKVTLEGRMDIVGAQQIETKMAGLAASHGRYLLIDLSGVDFLASIGIRTLLLNAKSLKQRNGGMVIFGALESVEKTLRTAGIDALIPIHADFQSARAEAGAPSAG